MLAWKHVRALAIPGPGRLAVSPHGPCLLPVGTDDRPRDLVELHVVLDDDPRRSTSRSPSRSGIGWAVSSAGCRSTSATVMVLHFYLDLPLTEAAEVLGIPVGTAKSRLHRGLATRPSAEEQPGGPQRRAGALGMRLAIARALDRRVDGRRGQARWTADVLDDLLATTRRASTRTAVAGSPEGASDAYPFACRGRLADAPVRADPRLSRRSRGAAAAVAATIMRHEPPTTRRAFAAARHGPARDRWG